MKNKIKNIINNKVILITGGTGSFGSYFLKKILYHYKPKKIVCFSRDELKQYQLKNQIDKKYLKKVRFLIGDIRDKDRVEFATKEIDVIIHAAALKQVDTAEYNPTEFIKTNVLGSENIVYAAIKNNVKKIVALSTDKACSPVNLYGATKLLADKLFVSANEIKGNSCKSEFSVLRYGNVMGSRGSVVPLFKELKEKGEIFKLTDLKMTRFSITLEEASEYCLKSLSMMIGGELFVPKTPSYRLKDLVKAFDYDYKKIKKIGLRPGEKIHEDLISSSDALRTINLKDFYIVTPHSSTSVWSESKFKAYNYLKNIKYCDEDFKYSSDLNKVFLTSEKLKNLIRNY